MTGIREDTWGIWGKRFDPGMVVATPGALELMDEYRGAFRHILARHLAGDWGEVTGEDAGENERSVEAGLRILSVYQLDRELAGDAGEDADPRARIWVITEADRSATTLLLPDEY